MQNIEKERQERLAKGPIPSKREAPSPAVQSLQKDKASPDKQLDRGLEDTFPASDPVSATTTIKPGGPQ
ncbi:hypothetical protein DTW90_31070 [Neorhizobium sp. P12A]|jgi:hypothetical protein|uniref:hypothetical protein n=1 Tax=Rhizobium/Agrobacterium group TaxID=227290 RepID=UPI001047C593|nr:MULTISPECIES: hypothetical protein [Rhizobium/Agrobacterium group]KAA0689554.1 hypothetical protein DTW90_31070 [Neorhizobium sp. P12A]TCR92716.1 hypothetical protein EV561_101152 [Rhizobium sp. BK376]